MEGRLGRGAHNLPSNNGALMVLTAGVTKYVMQYVDEEKELFCEFLQLVRKWDPDILLGYEVQMLSWGYLIQRALVFDMDLCKMLSRVIGSSSECNMDVENDKWGAAHTSELKIPGRIVLNVWRLMRHEVIHNIDFDPCSVCTIFGHNDVPCLALLFRAVNVMFYHWLTFCRERISVASTASFLKSYEICFNISVNIISQVTLNTYTFENVAFHVLHDRIPLFTYRTLSDWWDHKTDVHRWRTINHYVTRCHGNVRILEQVDFIGRTSELARLFGILFYSVISRGSQVFK